MLTYQQSSWERQLLKWAHEALDVHHHHPEPVLSGYEFFVRPPILEQAYQRCEEITRYHSRTFFLASGLLPQDKRIAVRALYAFCRISDDLVDRPADDPVVKLDDWRRQTLFAVPAKDEMVALAWADTRMRYRIPKRYAEQLIDGVARDITQTRYETFEDLATYCYGVASTVGLMAMHIIGFSGSEAIPYAVKLGVALQLTNILRDVGEDWRAGRLYLPQEELIAFGLTEEDISEGRVDDRWQKFMQFQLDRTRRLFYEAMPGIALLDPGGRFAIAAAAQLYQAILEDIEANHWDVFSRRAHVGTWGKIRRLPGIWWSSNWLYPQQPY